MFLHIGGEVVVLKKNLIAIIDLVSAIEGEATTEFIEISKDEGFLNIISIESSPKSMVITKNEVYLSPISSITLLKRAG